MERIIKKINRYYLNEEQFKEARNYSRTARGFEKLSVESLDRIWNKAHKETYNDNQYVVFDEIRWDKDVLDYIENNIPDAVSEVVEADWINL